MKRVIIVEGPDGGGKTKLSQTLTRLLQGMLVHHGSYLGVDGVDIWSAYDLSMRPAVKNVVPVVLDRCWLSEPIYGAVMRGGENRLAPDDVENLENTAHICSAVVVRCLPSLEVCLKTFEGRPQEEYLKKSEQLGRVWEGYRDMKTSLPVLDYDYTKMDRDQFARSVAEGRAR